ncbi:MAG: hypothetical protein EON54_12490 [Alcaligenaceae bacterium]|nr:MAG: hypothetical protein EON54_12490 [Alcaligenaceae bacterium]
MLKKTTIAAVALVMSFPAMADMATRYGKLTVNDALALQLNGKVVAPIVEGNSGLQFLSLYQIGDADVVVLQSVGGTACPIQLRLVTVRASGLRVSPEFGSCSELVTHTFDGEVVTFSMPKMQGKGNDVFRYAKGVVTQAGKPIK